MEEFGGSEFMETLDMALTYAIDIVMALGGGYIGTSLVLYLADRWNELEVKPKLQESQKVNIPLTLKATDAVPLELEQPELARASMPLEPIVAPAPERQELRTVVPDLAEPDRLQAPAIPEPEPSAPEIAEPVAMQDEAGDETTDEIVDEIVDAPTLEAAPAPQADETTM
jgi:hypothetical protein